MRKTFSIEVSNWIKQDHQALLLLGDIGVGSFKDVLINHPDRVINVGIIEQAMISFASGLALMEHKVIIHTIAPFLIGRAYEQIKIDFGYRNLPGLFVSVGASFDYGKLGSTHHAPEDIQLVSTIPDSRLFIPGSKNEIAEMLKLHRKQPKLDYLRLTEQSHSQQLNMTEGHSFLMKKKDKPTIVAIGPMLEIGIIVAKTLDYSLLYINTLDDKTCELFSDNTHPYFIIEPNFIGSTEYFLNRKSQCRVLIYSFGIPNGFYRDYLDIEKRFVNLGLIEGQILSSIQKLSKKLGYLR